MFPLKPRHLPVWYAIENAIVALEDCPNLLTDPNLEEGFNAKKVNELAAEAGLGDGWPVFRIDRREVAGNLAVKTDAKGKIVVGQDGKPEWHGVNWNTEVSLVINHPDPGLRPVTILLVARCYVPAITAGERERIRQLLRAWQNEKPGKPFVAAEINAKDSQITNATGV